jgi:hypothetical protein
MPEFTGVLVPIITRFYVPLRAAKFVPQIFSVSKVFSRLKFVRYLFRTRMRKNPPRPRSAIVAGSGTEGAAVSVR